MISATDEAALSWYFGPGLALYERSTVGAILAKLARDSAVSEPCKRCAGAGILEGPGGFAVTDACEACKGSGRAANGRTLCSSCGGFGTGSPRRKQAQQGGWCPDCSGTGATTIDKAKMRRTRCHVCETPDLPWAAGGNGRRRKRMRRANCCNCLGTGEEPVNVKPIHAVHEAGGVQANEEAITRFAVTSRRVAKVQQMSPLLVEVLAAWYGDVGQHREEEGQSRSSLLYRLSEEGREYLRAKEDQHSGSLQELRERADERSAELYVLAARAWNVQARAASDRAALVQLAEVFERLGYVELGKTIAGSVA